MKSALKKIPGLVAAVRMAKQLAQNLRLRMLRMLLNATSRTQGRRAAVFDVLSGHLAFAQHEEESYIVRTSDRVIGRILYSRGDFDFAKFENAYKIIFSKLALAEGKGLPILLDIGANIGSICIPAVRRDMVSQCIAFEPDAENFKLLSMNTILNDVSDRITLHQAAVGGEAGGVSIARSEMNSGDHRVKKASSLTADTVPMVPLDDFADVLDLRNTIVWMDIQGFEGFAVSGASQFCLAGTPMILEFCKPDLIDAGSYDVLISTLLGSSYTVFFDLNESNPEPRSLTEEALRTLADDLEAQDTFTDLLFLADE